MYDHILIGVDGSENAEVALPHAGALAESDDAWADVPVRAVPNQ